MYAVALVLAEQSKIIVKQAPPCNHHSNINERAKNIKSRKRNGIVEKGEKEKRYEGTKEKKIDCERRLGKRITTHNELKEENWEKQHGKGNKNNR